MNMKRVSVFCGSSSGFDPVYEHHAYELGKALAMHNITLVYGGARVGLMGRLANGVLENGGEAIGVIPAFLKDKEIAHHGLTELVVVKSLQERKTLMNDLSDGAIAMPGGFGTLEEFFEMLTWGQLSLHHKPVALLNINGYYNSLITFFNEMVSSGFLKPVNRDMVLQDASIENLLVTMHAYVAPTDTKWIGKLN
jgi:uncharacterized protein (TIGR00730 family)